MLESGDDVGVIALAIFATDGAGGDAVVFGERRGEFGFIAEFSDGWITLGRLLKVRRVYAVIREGLIIETVKTERSTVLAL